MDGSNPIIYELGLVIVVAVGFWLWQTIDLKRAARELKDREASDPAAAPPPDDRG
jgi:hypothetical protein